MNRWRTRYKDWNGNAAKSRDSGSTDAELSNAANDIYTEAEKHRQGVIARDKAAKARKKGVRRG